MARARLNPRSEPGPNLDDPGLDVDRLWRVVEERAQVQSVRNRLQARAHAGASSSSTSSSQASASSASAIGSIRGRGEAGARVASFGSDRPSYGGAPCGRLGRVRAHLRDDVRVAFISHAVDEIPVAPVRIDRRRLYRDSMFWIPFMRSNGPPWTLGDVVAKLGEVTEFETPIGTWKVRIKDGRLTSDPRRAEFLVEPA